MNPAQWAGLIFALLVVVPAAFIPQMGKPGYLLELRDSPWILVPVLGGALAGWILGRRTAPAFFGALAGFAGFWCAATWGAGSKATSAYEALAATGAGVLPVGVLYRLHQRFTRTKKAAKPETAPQEAQEQGMPFGIIMRRFRKQILLFGGAFVILTVMTIRDLNALEAGTVKSVLLWDVIVPFYERFGYWPAVLLPPVLGLVCGGVLCWSLMKRGTIHPQPPTKRGP
ncbi:MAG: hypothetical protein V4726_17980 [Verrucomicrobiota bacterium]